ncbi:MAG: HDOD domain-containing protein, partial [Gammaproteobacteria bacterium]|nr:HDOD domain-containing protein [Gammaproteobacteria bacterium]
MAEPAISQTFDRFIIDRELGRGKQGVVYLATDPELRRQVAIKAVHLNDQLQAQENLDQLLSEARIVSRLQHNNIVTIYDLGINNHRPYLVLEYFEGTSLQQKLREGLKAKDALRIMRDILSGVGAAHAQNIAHGDIKPANILINSEGSSKVADFGLAHFSDSRQSDSNALYGTPQYMAPEYIETRQHEIISDVFSIGLVFYEILAGKPAVTGDDIYQILNFIANEQIPAPSSINSAIDERLDDLILKALSKNTEQRYANAGAMLEAFNDYISLDDQPAEGDSHNATVAFLLRRMRHKSDFPVFSETINVLNKVSRSDTESLASVSNAILKDYSLTNKVLRLINSAYYNRGGGKISTISRAVVMLGVNQVRNIAAALMLFEHMQNKLQSKQLKEDAVESLFSALIANELASKQKSGNHEEAFLCALLRQLGKRLVRFYLHDESQAIEKLMSQDGISESAAVQQLLGTSYHQIGIAVAGEWGFPAKIIDSMKPVETADFAHTDNNNEGLQLISQFSNELSAILRSTDPDQKASIRSLTSSYAKLLKIDAKQVESIIETCQKELVEFARLIQFKLTESAFTSKFNEGKELHPTEGEKTHQREFDAASTVEILEEDTETNNRSTEKALTDGIQDITNTLTADYTINQIFQMILETIYRGFSNCRVLLCLKDKSGQA